MYAVVWSAPERVKCTEARPNAHDSTECALKNLSSFKIEMKLLRLVSFIYFSAVAAFAQPAIANLPSPVEKKPSDYLNEQLPSWLKFSGEFRMRFEESGSTGFNNPEDSYLLTRARFNISIQPARWLIFFGQTQDSRGLFQDVRHPGPPYQDTWDIRQAFVEIGDTEKGPIALIAGRQEINLGDQRLVGSSNWTNTARTFDGVRLSLRHAGYGLDAFASSVVDERDQELNHHTKGNDLHGLYGHLTSVIPAATIEPYVLWRIAPVSLSPLTEHGGRGKLNEKTAGVRCEGKLPLGFDYNIEMAKQFGSLGLDSVDAWAGHWLVGKSFSSAKWRPRWVVEYNYASGDSNPADGTRGTFDQLYPTAHLKYGLTDQVGWRNIEDVHTGLEVKATKRLALNGGFHDYRLAAVRDGLYNAAGALVARSRTGVAGRHVGEELEVYGTYDLNQTIQFALGYGHLFTGEFLNRTTRGHDYNYPYTMLTLRL